MHDVYVWHTNTYLFLCNIYICMCVCMYVHASLSLSIDTQKHTHTYAFMHEGVGVFGWGEWLMVAKRANVVWQTVAFYPNVTWQKLIIILNNEREPISYRFWWGLSFLMLVIYNHMGYILSTTGVHLACYISRVLNFSLSKTAKLLCFSRTHTSLGSQGSKPWPQLNCFIWRKSVSVKMYQLFSLSIC